MAAVGFMLLAFCALVGAGFSLYAGGAWGWLALALFLVSMGLEALAVVSVEMEEAAE